jgi:rhamnosyl/mannosyltransferase
MSRKLKILHIGKYFPPVHGGIEYGLYNLVDATSDIFDNTVLVADPKKGFSDTRAGGYRVIRIGETFNLFYNSIVPSLPGFLTKLRMRERFDVIVIHYPNAMANIAYLLSKRSCAGNEKMAVIYHSDVLLSGFTGFVYSLYSWIDGMIFRRADRVITTSPHLIRSSPVLSKMEAKCRVVPTMIDDHWAEATTEEKSASDAVGREHGDRIALFVGRLVEYKGLPVLIEAARDIEGKILIAGDGPLKGELETAIRRHGVGEKVVLLGRVENLKPYYLACDMFILPSISGLEAFGLVQLEAMAFGKPVVSSDLKTGVTYINRDGVTGLTFPVGDSRKLGSAVNRLFEDEGLRNTLGRNAKERVESEFVRSKVKVRFSGVIDELVS